MAKFTDYLPEGDPNKTKDGLSAEIDDASHQQQTRQEENLGATSVNWEERYKELEKLNSRQAQTLGEYRKTIDEFIANPTSNEADAVTESNTPITYEELYDNPNDAIQRAVESHPAIREARELKDSMARQERDRSQQEFVDRHPDYQKLYESPEFQNWVVENPMRVDLYRRGDQYDFNAADALFSLYKAEKGFNQVRSQQEIEQAELVESSGEIVVEPPKYSRSEYIDKLKRSRQGDLDAEDWVKRNARGYREALEAGNVRD